MKFTHKSINRDTAVSLGVKVHIEKVGSYFTIIYPSNRLISKFIVASFLNITPIPLHHPANLHLATL